MINKVTAEAIRYRKNSRDRIVALTAYDYPTARILDEGGVDLILVGDSLGMTVLGYPDTTHVVLEDMVYHTRAAARGISSALLASDLPIRSYDSGDQAVATASALVAAGADAVKLEGGQSCYRQIRAITDNGIPFIGHIGMLQEALAVEEGGAFAIVLELVEPTVAAEITELISIPTIGIGSGKHCDGQILVFHDLVGYFPWLRPKHVKPEADVASAVRDAVQAFIQRVRAGETGGGLPRPTAQ